MNLIQRPRRLRGNTLLRTMVRETRADASSLIYPMFVKEGISGKEEIPSMPGQYRWSIDLMPEKLEELRENGVSQVMLFGLPSHKDAKGSGAYDDNGIVQQALRRAKQSVPELYYITDVCLCEYTSHGHCGLLRCDCVDNDPTCELLAKTALSHVQAGADMVAPSDMMDGRIGAIRSIFDPFWIKINSSRCRSCLMPSNMLPHFMVRFVRRRIRHRHSEIGADIRWMYIMQEKPCARHSWILKRVPILFL